MTHPKTTVSPLTLTLFGPMQVLVTGCPIPVLRSRKSLWLLALLTLRHGKPVEREWLAGTLWPDADQEQALASLRPALSELRKALGDESERLQAPNRHSLQFSLTGADVDVAAFDAAIAAGSIPALARAVALYRGPLLEGCSEEWIGQERLVREQDCLRALGILTNAALTAGDAVAATEYARRAVALDPWSDAAQRSLMEALSKGGDTNAALQVYREFLEVLRSDPKAVPDEKISALYHRLRKEARRRAVPAAALETTASETIAPVVTGYLPHSLTDLVGREEERLEVAARLRRSRLVTLTGPGGIGKTRLAIEVAAEAAPEFADGVWLVALEALTEGSRIEQQIASVLGAQEVSGQALRESLTGHLRSRRLLLVLDNCEHLVEACAEVAVHLLRECAGIRILTTSREALGVTGEAVWAVPAMAAPNPSHLPTGQATQVRVASGYESVQLFVERAQAVQKTFALTGDNVLPVAQICFRLEGIPLAIELAAARIKSLTTAQIASRLDDHLSLLTGGNRAASSRQQTLRATLDWSYALLNGEEQLLLERLSVFASGWSLDAAEAVCAGEEIAAHQVLDLLTALVEKSLVVFEERENMGGRYRMLETVRQFATERLKSHEGTDRRLTKHLEWFLTFACTAGPELRGPQQELWLQRLEADHDNFRKSLAWIGTDPEAAEKCLRMAYALWWFWYVRGHLREGRQLLQQALDHPEVQAPTPSRAKALNGAGTLACIQGDHHSGKALFEESLSIFKSREDWENAASALGNLGNVALEQGDYASAKMRFEESLMIFRDVGKQQQVAATIGNLGKTAYLQDDLETAQRMYREALALFREMEDTLGIALELNDLGRVTSQQGDYPAAWAMYEESLSLFETLHDRRGRCLSLLGLGGLAYILGRYAQAAALYQESLSLSRQFEYLEAVAGSLHGLASVSLALTGPKKAVHLSSASAALLAKIEVAMPPADRETHEQQIVLARAALGEAAFDAAWDKGQSLTWEEAVAYAMEEATENLLGFL